MNFSPTFEEILLFHYCPQVYSTLNIEFHGEKFKVIDTMGFFNDRKKWVHFFDNISAVCYLVNLADDSPNFKYSVLEDTLGKFASITSSTSVSQLKFYIIFTHYHEFIQNLESHSLIFGAPKYKSEQHKEALAFISKEFLLADMRNEKKYKTSILVTNLLDQQCAKEMITDILAAEKGEFKLFNLFPETYIHTYLKKEPRVYSQLQNEKMMKFKDVTIEMFNNN